MEQEKLGVDLGKLVERLEEGKITIDNIRESFRIFDDSSNTHYSRINKELEDLEMLAWHAHKNSKTKVAKELAEYVCKGYWEEIKTRSDKDSKERKRRGLDSYDPLNPPTGPFGTEFPHWESYVCRTIASLKEKIIGNSKEAEDYRKWAEIADRRTENFQREAQMRDRSLTKGNPARFDS